MVSDAPTWRQAEADAEAAAVEWWDGLDDDDREAFGPGDADDAAAEYADACPDVIYTYNARAIWADSSGVRAYEGDIDYEAPSIDEMIAACVYLAIRDAFIAKAHALSDEWEPAGGEEDGEA